MSLQVGLQHQRTWGASQRVVPNFMLVFANLHKVILPDEDSEARKVVLTVGPLTSLMVFFIMRVSLFQGNDVCLSHWIDRYMMIGFLGTS